MARRRRKQWKLDLSLAPETRRGVFTVIVLAIAALLLLSLFDLAGTLGVSLDVAVSHVLGWDKIVLPFFLLAIGYHGISPERLPLRATNYIGFLLFFCSLNPLVHVATFSEVETALEALATAGGKLGLLIATPFVGFFGTLGAATLFTALFIVSLLLIFNTSLARIIAFFDAIWRIIRKILWGLLAPFRWVFHLISNRRENAVRETAALPGMEVSVVPIRGQEGADEEVDQGEDKAASGEEDPQGGDAAVRPSPKPRKRRPRIEIPIELLTKRDQRPTSGDIVHNQSVIQRTLETFGIPVEMGEVAVGPTVTQFTLKPSEGVKLAKITGLHNDLALALAAHPIRIEAPIPGKSLVGIEVPNQMVATVGVREILEAREWRERRTNTSFALGKDVAGKPWIADLARMPHLLVAGATGSGNPCV